MMNRFILCGQIESAMVGQIDRILYFGHKNSSKNKLHIYVITLSL